MNNYLFIDAVSYLDADLLAKHLEKKEGFKKKARIKKKTNLMKWSATIAACLTLIIIAIPVISNLIGYHSGLSEDEIFERSNTYYDNYEDLTAIVGNDTLLENVDFATLNDYELRLVHELDDVNAYHTVSFVNIMPEDEFGFGIHFPPYNKKTANFVDGGETVIINGVTVQYEKRRTEGSNFKYDIAAEFEYNGCCYQIRSTGNSDESVFWDNLNALLGAQ